MKRLRSSWGHCWSFSSNNIPTRQTSRQAASFVLPTPRKPVNYMPGSGGTHWISWLNTHARVHTRPVFTGRSLAFCYAYPARHTRSRICRSAALELRETLQIRIRMRIFLPTPPPPPNTNPPPHTHPNDWRLLQWVKLESVRFIDTRSMVSFLSK